VIIERVELKDFLSHKSSTLAFGRGLTVIIGPNGAGKSSIIEGIVFALFQDSFRNMRSGTKESLKRIGAKSASVKLTFSVGGRGFRVERLIERGAVDRLYEEDKLVATQASYVDKKVLEVLGIPRKEAYLNTVIVRQGELERVLENFTTASGREDLMKALGFKELDDIAEALKEERAEYEKRFMKLLGEAAQLEGLKRQLEKSQEELRGLEGERNKILENLRALEKGLSYIERALAEVPETVEQELNKAVAEYYKVKGDLEGVKREVKRLQEEVDRLSALKREASLLLSALALKERLLLLRDKLERTSIAHLRLEELRKTTERLRERLTQRIRVLSSVLQCPPDVNSILRAYEGLKAEVESKEGKVSSLRATIEEKRAMLASLEKSEGECPLCGAELTDEARDRVRGKIESELSKAVLELEGLSRSLEREKSVLQEVEKLNVAGLVDELSSLREEEGREKEEERALVELTKGVNKVLEEILSGELSGDLLSKLRGLLELVDSPREATKVVEQILGFVSRAEGRMEELERISWKEEEMSTQIESLKKVEEELRQKAIQLEKAVEEFKKKVEARRRLVEEHNKVRAQVAEYKGRLAGIESNIESCKRRVEELRDLCAKAESAERESERLKKFLDFLDFLRTKVFGKDGLIAKSLRKAYKAKLESEVNNYLARFGMDFEVEFDEDLGLKVVARGEEMSVDSLSGGERAVLALSIRLALAKALSNREVELMILDEPTANLDADRRRELVRVLRELADEVPQVIVVTHDPEVAEAADYVYRVKKDGGISIVEEY